MAPLPILVYYDFASSFCYTCHVVTGRIAKQLEAEEIELVWRPIDLTEMVPWTRGDRWAPEQRTAVELAAAELGVELEMPEIWMDSRLASAVALSLEGELERRWRDAVWNLVFAQRRSLDEPGLLAHLASQLGIDWPADAIGDLHEATRDSTAAARAQGVVGVPTFLLGEYPVGGVQDDQTMLELLRRFAAKQRQEADDERPN